MHHCDRKAVYVSRQAKCVVTDILAKLAALTIGDENCQLSERLRELANAIQVWDGETPAAKLLFDAADRLAYEAALIALVPHSPPRPPACSRRAGGLSLVIRPLPPGRGDRPTGTDAQRIAYREMRCRLTPARALHNLRRKAGEYPPAHLLHPGGRRSAPGNTVLLAHSIQVLDNRLGGKSMIDLTFDGFAVHWFRPMAKKRERAQ